MKLKINTKSTSAPDTQPNSSIEGISSSNVKLKLKPPKPPDPFLDLPPGHENKREKRKYSKKGKVGLNENNGSLPKKRTLAESYSPQAVKRQATHDSLTRGNSSSSISYRPLIPTIKIKSRPAVAPRQITVKHRGRPPPRPTGVGYDSEAEGIEEDPAIESQFVLRMLPGEDCNYVKEAIDEKKFGLPLREGGADVNIRFLDREGRRAVISICGRLYAAVLVDLPCIVEGMKSWDKRGWWKSADICQMLLVVAQVPNEEAAKAMPLPREVDQVTYQYPHGLTPPMHYVRKRRFRKRVSHRTIEAVEEEVERLMRLDESVRADGGSTEYEMLDLDQYRNSSSQPETDVELYGASVDGDGVFDDDDETAMAQLMEQELGQELDDEQIFSTDNPTPEAGVLTVTTNETNSIIAASPSAVYESEEEDDSDIQADEAEEADEADEENMNKRQERLQQLEEIADLEKEISVAKGQLGSQSNMLLRQRLGAKVMSLQSDLDVKKAGLGDNNP